MHYRLMYPSDYLNAADLHGKDVTVTIGSVTIEDVPDPQGKKKKKAVVLFQGKSKKWPLPKTCAKQLAKKFGPDADGWVGKAIVIFPTTCVAFGEAGVECVLIRD